MFDKANKLCLITVIKSFNETTVKGELIAKGIKRIVKINEYNVSIEPKTHMLLVPHTNKPGMVAVVAGVLGADNFNISGMQVVQGNSDKSIMIINIDTKVEKSTLDKINKIDGVFNALRINI